MADFQNTTLINTNTFSKGMNKDISPEMLQEGQYFHAINSVNNSDKGDLFKIGNEPSNIKCASFPYTYIGAISLTNNRYAIFSTDDTNSEIGIFEDKNCKYTTLISDAGKTNKLGFKRTNLIKGVSKENIDCTETLYWDDGINPSRMLNINKIPYVIEYRRNPEGGCDIEVPTSEINVEKLRMTPFITVPSVEVKRGDAGGNLPNGSYRIAFAYADDKDRVTDILSITNPVFIFSQTFANGSIEVTIKDADVDFKNYQLILISTVNQQTTARILGIYPVEQKTVYIDTISQTDKTIDLSNIPLQSVYYESSDGIFRAGDYIVKAGPRTRPEFNYQPQATKIRTKWVAYAVPENYYRRGGTKIGYTKGEVISLFIRFVYNTGHRSASTPLIGREALADEKSIVSNKDTRSFEGERVEKWEIYDTSTITRRYPASNAEEYPVMEGELGYYESENIYPDNKEVWGANACKPVRHGVFPDNSVVPNYDPITNKILILGLKFENISYPLDENKKPVKGIVGYEILRGDKEGNKSIVAKGLIYNTGEYELPISYNSKVKGLYPNYPFNDLRVDPYLSGKYVKGGCNGSGYTPVGTYNRQLFTFHSPETSFTNPSLASYLKVEAEYSGKAQGYFEPVHKHPKHKLVRDFALILAAAVGIGEGILAIKGRTTKTYTAPIGENKGEVVTGGVGAQVAGAASASGWQTGYNAADMLLKNSAVTNIISDTLKPILETLGITLGAVPGATGGGYTYTTTDTAYKNVPLFLKIGTNVVLFSYFFGQGTSVTLNLIRQIVPFRQHAFQCNMEGFYSNQNSVNKENMFRKIEDYTYLYSGYQSFQGFRVNNNLRESSVLLKLNDTLANPSVEDNSRTTIGQLKQWENPEKPFERNISAYYVSIKRRLRNLYSQLESVKIVPTGNEIFPIVETDKNIESGFVFGGDTVIEEFTLKRKNNFFTQTQADSLLGNPDGYEFDYKLYANILYPRYWMDTQEYDLTQLFNLSNIKLPNDSYYLDRDPAKCRRKIGFTVKDGYMYTSVNGVVRFYVESSYNLPFRKNLVNEPEKKHYDKEISSDLSELFRSDIIKKDNYYEIDKSLSPIKQLNLTYSAILPRDFSVKNNKCYVYEPNKMLYSLPSTLETSRDNWRTFLVNNFTLFPKADGRLTTVKSVNRTGIMYFFSSGSVKIHSGVDELETANGVKIQIGDGGLFARPLQSVTNTDDDFTECQSSQSVVATQYGIFFISQRQGKLFNYAGQVKDISAPLKWWLAEYLPSKLIQEFPDFELNDNPVIGVGCSTVFDATNEIIYFSKRDYSVRKEFKDRITYLEKNIFKLDNRASIELGNPTYFEDASWTLSYDPKTESYISFHDWHPEAMFANKTHFSTIKDSSIWKHNESKESFCNFYGVDSPWEIHYPVSNIQNVSTLETIEYQLEAYKYFNEGRDRHHILYDNFDRAIVYNSEQCSGVLRLNLRKWNDPSLILQYPQYTANGVNVEVTKQENVYRLNQFKDLTKNRGQFTFNWRTIWNTEENGYKLQLNTNNIDYAKQPQFRKKFRHRVNMTMFRKNKCENTKFLLTLVNTKSIKSFR